MADETGVGYPRDTHQRICALYNFGSAQQDAHDFILTILQDGIQDRELKKLIEDRFYYTFTTTTTCVDGSLPQKTQGHDMFIPLAKEELAGMENNVVLSRGIENYQREILALEQKLKRCEDQGFYKKITLQGGSQLPRFLWIQLKLFGSEGGLKLSDYETVVKEETMTILGVEYELLGFITHIGNTIQGGHYVCTVKHGITWYQASDTDIQPVPPLPETYSAYLIVYRRKEEQTSPNSMFPTISPEAPKSMKNYGNSCFANSALQLLKQTGLNLNLILHKLAPPAAMPIPPTHPLAPPAPAPVDMPIPETPPPVAMPIPATRPPAAMPIPATHPPAAMPATAPPAAMPATAPPAAVPATPPSKKEIQEMIIFLDRILKWQQ
jgi:uncharacterized UBP type Zn finger protein